MASSQMAILSRTRTLLLLHHHHHHHHHHLTKSITSFPFISQEPQLAEPTPPPTTTTTTTSLPPNPASGSPLYNENWRSPIPPSSFAQSSIIPHGFNQQDLKILANSHDSNSLMDLFTVWTASKRWADITALFEAWVRSIDIKTGKRNKPDVNLFNNYLRAKLMNGASAYEMVDLVEQMDDFRIAPNLASFKLVLKACQAANEADAAEILIELIESFTESFDFDEKDLASEENLWDLYGRWMSHHNVSRSLDEKHKRFNEFKVNAMHVHNTNKVDKPYKLELNEFADLTEHELTSMYTGLMLD